MDDRDLAGLSAWHGIDDLSGPSTPVVPAVGLLGAAFGLYVAYRMLRAYPLWPWSRGRGGAASSPGERGVVWFGAGTGLVGLTALLPVVGGWLGLGGMALATAVTGAGLAAGAAFVPGVLSLAGPAATLALRARRALDGVIVGLCLMFCVWTVVISPHGSIASPAFWIVMFHCCVLSTAVICGLGPVPGSADGHRDGRRAARLCVAGVGAATVGVVLLAFALAHRPGVGWLLATGLLLVAAPLLVWRGTAALAPARPVLATRAAVIAVPMAMAPMMALYGLLAGGAFDRAQMMVGTLAAFAVGARQLLMAVPLSRPTAVAQKRSGAPRRGRAGGPADPARPAPAARLDIPGTIDPVTGLPTRSPLLLAVSAARAVPRSPGSLLLVGLAGLTDVPGADRDEALREVARRLRLGTAPAYPGAGEPDLVARWCETGFAVLTGANVLRAYALANRLLTLVTEPVLVPGGTVAPGATVGLSACVGLTHIGTAPSAEDVLRRAQVALHRARQLGPGRVEWYDTSVEEAMQRQRVIERDLPDALGRGELDLIYQPIMDLVRGRPLAVEALLRWRHPRLGTLLPADVIPVAEETGMIGEVGHWVLGQAFAQLASWRRGGRDLLMSVNVSPRQFDTDTLPGEVGSLLAAHHLPADRLVLEVAESGIGDGAALAGQVGALRTLGVRTALDEFGVGAASLAHLRRLPIDMVKISQSYFEAREPNIRHFGDPACATTPLGRVSSALPLIDVLVGVGRRLGVDVVAQGLEAPEQLAIARTAGCRLGQGHIFARPQPAEHTEAYLAGFPAGSSRP